MRLLILGLTLALVWRVFLAQPTQQDNYATYAESLVRDRLTSLPWAETRLFPGYPLLIGATAGLTGNYVFSGVAISVITGLGAIILFYLITQDSLAAVIWGVFPPVWVELGAKVATEPLTMLLFMLSIYLFKKKKAFWAGYLAGLTVMVRLIAGALFLAEIITVAKKDRKALLGGFIVGSANLLIYNLVIFGPKDLFHQLLTNPRVGGAGGLSIGLWQLPQDMVRAFANHQWRIAIVGTVYVLLVGVGTYLLYRYKEKIELGKLWWAWHLANLVFVLSLSPVPLLEEFSRYIVPSYPALILAFSQTIRKRIILTE